MERFQFTVESGAYCTFWSRREGKRRLRREEKRREEKRRLRREEKRREEKRRGEKRREEERRGSKTKQEKRREQMAPKSKICKGREQDRSNFAFQRNRHSKTCQALKLLLFLAYYLSYIYHFTRESDEPALHHRA